MERKEYSYGMFARVFGILFNILGWVMPALFIYMFVKLLVGLIRLGGAEILFSQWIILIALWLFLVPFSFVCIVMAGNFFCDIVIEEQGVTGGLLGHWLPVEWEDIVEIKPCWYNLPWWKAKLWVVATRSLTPFHRFYGVLYVFWGYPSFVFSSGLKGGEQLVYQIKKQARKNARQRERRE